MITQMSNSSRAPSHQNRRVIKTACIDKGEKKEIWKVDKKNWFEYFSISCTRAHTRNAFGIKERKKLFHYIIAV